MKRALRIWAVTLMIIAGSGLAGCSGGGAQVQTHTTTLGQELSDLEATYKKGIITEKQYEEAKNNLIRQRTEN